MPIEYTKKYAAESYETAQGRFKGQITNFHQWAGGSQNVCMCVISGFCCSVDRSALFWNIMQQPIGPIFKGQEILQDGTDRLSQNVGKNFHFMLRSIPEEYRSYMCVWWGGTLFTTACHLSLSCARWIQSTSCLYIQDSFYKSVWLTTSKSRNIKRRIIMVMDLGQTQKWDTKFYMKAKICSTDEVRKYSYCSLFLKDSNDPQF
jgi:hypothetical protein